MVPCENCGIVDEESRRALKVSVASRLQYKSDLGDRELHDPS